MSPERAGSGSLISATMKGTSSPSRAHDRVEVELAGAVRQPLAEQAMRVGDVRDLGRRAELLDVALERELLVRGEPEERRVRGGEGAEQRGVRGVEA